MTKEPVTYSAGIVAIANAIIPVLMLFGVIDWTPEQTGAVILAIGVITTTVGAWFARSQVTPI